jgi:hypothetical protein
VLDGSEDYAENGNNTILYSITISSNCKRPISNSVTNFVPFKCDKRVPVAADSIYLGLIGNSIAISKDGLLGLSLDDKTKSEILSDLKNNPVTVVYQLASPKYEPISTESILCDSYVNGHLDVDSAVPIEKVAFKTASNLKLNYLYPSAQYTVQFESDNNGEIVMNLGAGGATPVTINVTKGINKFNINTSNSPYFNEAIINGIGFNASNIQVVATDRNVDFGYFKGLQSSFESELVTDETDENYGKYKVECKVTGKNKFDGLLESGDIDKDTGVLKAANNCIRTVNYIDVRSMNKVTFTRVDHTYVTSFRLYDSSYNYIGNATGLGSTNTATIDVSNVSYIKFRAITSDTTIKYQLEEGTKATPYEPYQEYTKTIYLNSPLLKGDKLVVVNGKLCHYHKMGMVVLDGSEGWIEIDNNRLFRLHGINIKFNDNLLPNVYSNNFPSISRKSIWADGEIGISNIRTGANEATYQYGVSIRPPDENLVTVDTSYEKHVK